MNPLSFFGLFFNIFDTPDANPLTTVFWMHFEEKTCCVCYPNTKALNTTVSQEWDAMTKHYRCIQSHASCCSQGAVLETPNFFECTNDDSLITFRCHFLYLYVC
uniref:Uncharacterized protein n=1 Tax=Lepeophtheirus salmonis TaxID=72036 RepID=A0A0K2UTL1_LEPSM